ncbi:DNA polymerase IV [Actinoplanes sp. NPDC051861]|uniref:DNA polymerase IV n=1 Tax=Actinoplanes sp. NPDC051861 TaxID=3155170 RepID=UPI00341D0FB6
MRAEPSILHVDLDAMFAAVEQRDKVSLRGRPVVVGGVAGRGVVSTASYEARAWGVRSAMPMAQARRRLPAGTAYLSPRFAAYQRTSAVVMALLHGITPLVEQVSIDEAYLDLAAGGHDLTPRGVTDLALRVKREIAAATGGITGSVGVASSKLLAKIGSELRKPDGLTVVPAGAELTVLHPLPVGTLGGVGPATEQRLHRAGVRTVGDLAGVALEDLVDWFGTAHGNGLFRLARADDDRPVVGEREAKSISAEETFDVDLTNPAQLTRELDLLSARVAGRLRSNGLTGRTVNIKVRYYDFTTVTRAVTRDQPTDDPRLVAQIARRLLAEIDTSSGIRLLGVGVSTLADFAQDDLFSTAPEDSLLATFTDDRRPGFTDDRRSGDSPPEAAMRPVTTVVVAPELSAAPPEPVWRPGQDVRHDEHGAGWVWGSGLGRVTVRFEGPHTPPGPVRTFAVGDPALHPADPPDWTEMPSSSEPSTAPASSDRLPVPASSGVSARPAPSGLADNSASSDHSADLASSELSPGSDVEDLSCPG